jgi:NAD(P)-dependent dehydrogenase (short-subunit alcohol dehydrogenase family)
LVITGRDQQTLTEAGSDLEASLVLQVDVTSLTSLDFLAERIKQKYGRVDMLFVNAGIAKLGTLDSISEADFDAVMDANLKGAFFTIQKLLPLYSNGASIILNGSVNAHVGFGGASIYSSSKAALHSFAHTLSVELRKRQIRVNTLTIGPVNTPLYGKLGIPATALEGFAKTVQGKTVVNRFEEASEIGKAAVFLASNNSSFVVGTELTTDGGLMLNMA